MKKFIICLTAAFLLVALFSTNVTAEDRLKPKRLSSIGDSITEGMNAELPLENHYTSWANGYYGFWQWLFGLTNVNSHNQRITSKYGRWGRRNYMEAEAGATILDFEAQAQKAVDHRATYVTVFLGHNDLCLVSDITDLSDSYYAVFKAKAIAGLDILKGLPYDATINVVGLANVSELFAAAMSKTDALIVDCASTWAIMGKLGFAPCENMICQNTIECAHVVAAIENFNEILYDVFITNNADKDHYYEFTYTAFDHGIISEELSDIDCFHPSAEGQKELSRITWEDGPFFP